MSTGTYSQNDKKLLKTMAKDGPAGAIEEMSVDPEEFEDENLREAARGIASEFENYILQIDGCIKRIDEAIELIEDDAE